MSKLKKKKPLSTAALTSAGTAPAKWLGIRSDVIVTLMSICDMSVNSFGFTPQITTVYCHTQVLGMNQTGFSIYMQKTVATSAQAYLDSLAATLGPGFVIGSTDESISVKQTPPL